MDSYLWVRRSRLSWWYPFGPIQFRFPLTVALRAWRQEANAATEVAQTKAPIL